MSLAWCLQHESFQIRKRAGVGGGGERVAQGCVIKNRRMCVKLCLPRKKREGEEKVSKLVAKKRHVRFTETLAVQQTARIVPSPTTAHSRHH